MLHKLILWGFFIVFFLTICSRGDDVMWDQNNNAESIKEHNAQPLNLYFI